MMTTRPNKINLGCRNNLLPDHVNIDTCNLQGGFADQVLQINALELDMHFRGNSIEEVRASHFFEHLTHFQVSDLLYKIWGILKPGGKLIIIVPDFPALIDDFQQRHRVGDFSTVDLLHLKVFNTEEETPHQTVWYEAIGRYYLEREGLFHVTHVTHPTKLEVLFRATKLDSPWESTKEL